MAKIKLTLPLGEIPVNGKQVTFVAPCDCSAADGIQIDGVDYDVVDSAGNVVPFGKGVWGHGAVLTVTLDVTNRKAYLQNQNSYTKLETLSDETKALYGMGEGGTPNEAFAKLHETAVGVKNLWNYCWKRRPLECEIALGELKNVYATYGSQSSNYNLSYSAEVNVSADGTVSLKDPQTLYYTYSSFSDATLEILKGKYVTGNFYNASLENFKSAPRYVPLDATYAKGFNPGGAAGYYWVHITACTVSATDVRFGDYEFAFSPSINDHARTGKSLEEEMVGFVVSGYEYEFLGSVARNSLAYYQLNSEAVLNALLGLEGITYE